MGAMADYTLELGDQGIYETDLPAGEVAVITLTFPDRYDGALMVFSHTEAAIYVKSGDSVTIGDREAVLVAGMEGVQFDVPYWRERKIALISDMPARFSIARG